MSRPILTLKSKITPEAVPTKLSANDIIKIFVDKFPLVFFQGTEPKKPLSRGIHYDLFDAETGLSRTVIRRGLAAYTRRTSYLKSVAAGGARFNLDGIKSSFYVTSDEIEYSTKLLSKRQES